MKPDEIGVVGAELYPKFFKLLGYNDEPPLLCPPDWSKEKFQPSRYIGSPLSKELYHALKQGGYHRICVFFHDPSVSDLTYADGMIVMPRHCLILLNQEGYVVKIHPEMWYKYKDIPVQPRPQ